MEYDSIFSFKYSVRPNTPALSLGDHIPEEEKSRRLIVLQERQRAIQLRRNSNLIGSEQEALVEGFNSSTGQWIGRTSQNRVLNFTAQHPHRNVASNHSLALRHSSIFARLRSEVQDAIL